MSTPLTMARGWASTEHDTEALARVILPALPNHCCPPDDVTDCPYNAHEASGVAEVVLASDWLAAHDAALIAKAKAEGAVEAYRLNACEAVLADREAELLAIKGPCSNKACRLHYAHSGPCVAGIEAGQ